MADSIEDIVDDNVLEDAQFSAAMQASGNKIYGDEVPGPAPDSPEEKKKDEANFRQWALGGNGRYTPVGASTPNLPSGVYEPFATPGSWGLEELNISSDEIYELPDMATNVVLDEIERFWNNEDRYRKHNLLYKRGVILYGPPGSGKSVAVKLLIKRLIERNGIVIVVHNVPLAIMCLKALKRIEPKRNIICVFEDIDEILQSNGEAVVLSMLDGEHNVDRVLNVATTNYADRLGARIVNRPSRFDRRVKVDMPGEAARRAYIQSTTGNTLTTETVDQWVADTDQMSIAHLRELVAAVFCLDQSYEEVVNRLKEMATGVKTEVEFKRGRSTFGFASNSA